MLSNNRGRPFNFKKSIFGEYLKTEGASKEALNRSRDSVSATTVGRKRKHAADTYRTSVWDTILNRCKEGQIAEVWLDNFNVYDFSNLSRNIPNSELNQAVKSGRLKTFNMLSAVVYVSKLTWQALQSEVIKNNPDYVFGDNPFDPSLLRNISDLISIMKDHDLLDPDIKKTDNILHSNGIPLLPDLKHFNGSKFSLDMDDFFPLEHFPAHSGRIWEVLHVFEHFREKFDPIIQLGYYILFTLDEQIYLIFIKIKSADEKLNLYPIQTIPKFRNFFAYNANWHASSAAKQSFMQSLRGNYEAITRELGFSTVPSRKSIVNHHFELISKFCTENHESIKKSSSDIHRFFTIDRSIADFYHDFNEGNYNMGMKKLCEQLPLFHNQGNTNYLDACVLDVNQRIHCGKQNLHILYAIALLDPIFNDVRGEQFHSRIARTLSLKGTSKKKKVAQTTVLESTVNEFPHSITSLEHVRETDELRKTPNRKPWQPVNSNHYSNSQKIVTKHLSPVLLTITEFPEKLREGRRERSLRELLISFEKGHFKELVGRFITGEPMWKRFGGIARVRRQHTIQALFDLITPLGLYFILCNSCLVLMLVSKHIDNAQTECQLCQSRIRITDIPVGFYKELEDTSHRQLSDWWRAQKVCKLSSSMLSNILGFHGEWKYMEAINVFATGKQADIVPTDPMIWGSASEKHVRGTIVRVFERELVLQEVTVTVHPDHQDIVDSADDIAHVVEFPNKLGLLLNEDIVLEYKSPRELHTAVPIEYVPQIYLHMNVRGYQHALFCSWTPRSMRVWYLRFNSEYWKFVFAVIILHKHLSAFSLEQQNFNTVARALLSATSLVEIEDNKNMKGKKLNKNEREFLTTLLAKYFGDPKVVKALVTPEEQTKLRKVLLNTGQREVILRTRQLLHSNSVQYLGQFQSFYQCTIDYVGTRPLLSAEEVIQTHTKIDQLLSTIPITEHYVVAAGPALLFQSQSSNKAHPEHSEEVFNYEEFLDLENFDEISASVNRDSDSGDSKLDIAQTDLDLHDDGDNCVSHCFGVSGISNIGQTCFMSSVLQCVFNLTFFYTFHHKVGTDDVNLSLELVILFKQYLLGLAFVSPKSFHNSLLKATNQFPIFRQQCAAEFCEFLIHHIVDDNKDPLSNDFIVTYNEEIRCGCELPSSDIKFYALVPVPLLSENVDIANILITSDKTIISSNVYMLFYEIGDTDETENSIIDLTEESDILCWDDLPELCNLDIAQLGQNVCKIFSEHFTEAHSLDVSKIYEVHDNEIVLSSRDNRANIPIFGEDIKRVRDDMLEDEVINTYMVLINKKYPSHYCLPTHFLATMLSEDSNSAKMSRWLKHVPNFFSLDSVCIPVHSALAFHWSLWVINFKQKRYEFHCSLGRTFSASSLRHIRIFLRDHWQLTHPNQIPFNDNTWRICQMGDNGPIQQDSISCGVYMLSNILCNVKGLPIPFKFSHEDVMALRPQITIEIMTQTLFD
eukprot:Lithocolla_globosa_v1_NODE_14_length_10648_cov_86.543283.p2 type:complete len:1477 gc:universal NODE_14_length_10648_cov_86.543283:5945-10375(+)